jgi:tetratricopeptide (TPR) repeat protein
MSRPQATQWAGDYVSRPFHVRIFAIWCAIMTVIMSLFLPHASGRALLPSLLLLSLLPMLSGCGTKEQNIAKVQNTLREAKRHAQVDPTDKQAREWVDRAIAIEPNSADTYVGQEDPNGIFPILSVAIVFSTVGDDTALVDYMSQAAQKFPTDDRPLQILVEALGRLGRTAERKAAAAKLAVILTNQLAKPGAQNLEGLSAARAKALWDSGDSAGGTAEYRKGIQAYPTMSFFPNGLAYNFAEAKTNLPEALILAQKGLSLAQRSTSDSKDSEIAVVQDTLGWVQYRLGDLKSAELNLQEAVSAIPRQPELRYHLGSVYAAEGKTDAARSEFTQALRISSDYLAAKQALAALPKSTTPSSS